MAEVVTGGEALKQLEALPPEIVARLAKLYERLERWPHISGAETTDWLAGRPLAFADGRLSPPVPRRRRRDHCREGWAPRSILRKVKEMATEIQTLTIEGQRFVIMPESQYREMLGDNSEPPMPQADANGNYPAVASARLVLARKLIRRRSAVGLTQKNTWQGGPGCAWKP